MLSGNSSEEEIGEIRWYRVTIRPLQIAEGFFYTIGLGCQKAVSSFLSSNLHKAESILFRCTKIRKSKSA